MHLNAMIKMSNITTQMLKSHKSHKSRWPLANCQTKKTKMVARGQLSLAEYTVVTATKSVQPFDRKVMVSKPARCPFQPVLLYQAHQA